MTFRDIIIEPVVPVPAVATIAVALTVLTWFAYRQVGSRLREVPIALFDDKREVGRTSLAITDPSEPCRLTAEFTPEKTRKFRALARFPDGTSQEARFIVLNDNPEETEVAADVTYLKRLCSQSGGRLAGPERADATRAGPAPRQAGQRAQDAYQERVGRALAFLCDWPTVAE